MRFDDFVALMAPYFEDGGHMIDQAWQPRLTEGMVRCYLVQDRVAGYGLQAVNALYPAAVGDEPGEAPDAGPRLYHPPEPAATREPEDAPRDGMDPRAAAPSGHSTTTSCRCCGTATSCAASAPCAAEERYVLCEINVSSVAPFPDSVIEPLVIAAARRIEAARSRLS